MRDQAEFPLEMLPKANSLPSCTLVFLMGFLWAVLGMTLAREWIIPAYIPSTAGHILGDPVLYHGLALEQLDNLVLNGWRHFEFQPGGHGPAGIASLLYFFYPNPYAVVVLNALLHAIACAAMTRLLLFWFTPAVSILACLPLLVSPASIVWLSQLNKESYAIAGVSLLMMGFVGFLMCSIRSTLAWRWIVWTLIGACLIWIARPYLNQMLLLGLVLFSALFLGWSLTVKRYACSWRYLCHACILAVVLGGLSSGGASGEGINRLLEKPVSQHNLQPATPKPPSSDTEHAPGRTREHSTQIKDVIYPHPSRSAGQAQKLGASATTSQTLNAQPILTSNSDQTLSATQRSAAEQSQTAFGASCYRLLQEDRWTTVDWLPNFLNTRLTLLASMRCHNLELQDIHDHPMTQQSVADTHLEITGVADVIRYAPRGLQLGFFAPLPSQWPEEAFLRSYFYTTVIPLVLLFYAGSIATIVWAIKRRIWSVFSVYVLAIPTLWIYGISTSFMGSLVRYRYPVWVVLLCIGTAALLSLTVFRRYSGSPTIKLDET